MPQTKTATRLAKNTLFMYFRMGMLLIISLYTSRVVLEKLGVEDYGIYNVVGSIVAIFGSLRSLFSTSTQRFLSTDIGRNDEKNLIKTFNHSIYINVFFAVVMIIIAELFGLWFLNGYINVDSSRLIAAKWVFQFSVFSAAILIINSSFEALCIAHEKMSFYAYISIAEGSLQLLIVFLLSFSPIDQLVFYSSLRFCICIFLFLANILFCKHNFKECYFKRCYDRLYLKQMLSFSGWSFWGSTSYILTQQGLNMVLNVFGGPIVNAARGIAYQVNSVIKQFMSNIVVAIRPYCIKTYAEGNLSKTSDTLFLFTKVSFCIYMWLIIPIVFCTPELLQLWLGKVPDYSVVFVQLVLLHSLIRTFHPAVDLFFMAVGKIKWYQICESFVLILPLITSYYLLLYGLPYYSVFIGVACFEIINLIIISLIASKIAEFPSFSFLRDVISHCIVCIIIALYFYVLSVDSLVIWVKFAYIFIVLLLITVYMYFICLNQRERSQINGLVNSTIYKICQYGTKLFNK